jgi:predicted GNAT family N-acyltransferase
MPESRPPAESPSGGRDWRVREAALAADGDAIRAVREAVFIREQGVPADLEWDGRDGEAIHLLALAPDGQAVGTARLLPGGRLGRMAVLRAWRGRGIGSALLARAIGIARREGLAGLQLSAQSGAVAFYDRHGFAVEGAEFEEAGIRHRRMVLAL